MEQNKTLSLVSLVLAIVGIVLSFTVAGWIGLILSIVALVLACVDRKKGKNGMNTAAMVISIIAIVITVVAIIVAAVCVSAILGMAGALA